MKIFEKLAFCFSGPDRIRIPLKMYLITLFYIINSGVLNVGIDPELTFIYKSNI